MNANPFPEQVQEAARQVPVAADGSFLNYDVHLTFARRAIEADAAGDRATAGLLLAAAVAAVVGAIPVSYYRDGVPGVTEQEAKAQRARFLSTAADAAAASVEPPAIH